MLLILNKGGIYMRKNKIKTSFGGKLFDLINILLFIFLSAIMLFPIWNVLTTSLVGIGEFYARPIILWPNEMTFVHYQYIFSSDKMLRTFAVTTFVTVVGTVYNLLVNTGCAYGLSKKYLPGRNVLLTIFTFTMFFSGGLIPYYLLIRDLGLMNKIWVLILPGGVSIYNLIIMKSFFNQLPVELEESAKLDGANDIFIFIKIVLPLSMPLLATFALFNAVGFWNAWFDAMLFIQNRDLHPLQLVMRQMIVDNNMPVEMQAKFIRSKESSSDSPIFEEGLKTATVIIATVPILVVYPWLQKYFAKGVMIGSIKG
jgi:putative aldouronate transport system permease protein